MVISIITLRFEETSIYYYRECPLLERKILDTCNYDYLEKKTNILGVICPSISKLVENLGKKVIKTRTYLYI